MKNCTQKRFPQKFPILFWTQNFPKFDSENVGVTHKNIFSLLHIYSNSPGGIHVSVNAFKSLIDYNVAPPTEANLYYKDGSLQMFVLKNRAWIHTHTVTTIVKSCSRYHKICLCAEKNIISFTSRRWSWKVANQKATSIFFEWNFYCYNICKNDLFEFFLQS